MDAILDRRNKFMPKPKPPTKPSNADDANDEDEDELPEHLSGIYESVFERIGCFFEECEDQEMFEEQYCDVADELTEMISEFLHEENVASLPESFFRLMKEQTEKHIRQIELNDEADELEQANICEEEMELIL